MKGTQTVSNGSDGARDVRWGILFKGVVAAASAAAAAGMLRLFAMSAGMERIDERTLKMAADFEAVRAPVGRRGSVPAHPRS